ncbi:hypothetical protein RY831_21105 [Noviherbaspirillum sp. CPCC 100848]|uniref:Uncharacterized protein n=1 Tax=Noviherbaspirillum album TaxID=3080276 RepID=A0ABU6JDZ0_9BURK|nr:hypothetical protein [Noviherbaspirillum sp. CPCC 100848]MEC4721671.1 hypothetical protein [Noviherbaspirillum sp. CPCC 100848]
MDTGQDKEQARVERQVAQPADGSLKMHGDQLEKPLHEMLEDDDNHQVDPGEAETESGKRSPQQRQ